jgi:dolichyl-phosphate beta-glucosyltransferase
VLEHHDQGYTQRGPHAATPVRLTYLIPVHNEEPTLAPAVDRLVERLASFPEASIFLLENGSRDRSWPLCQRLAAGEHHGVTVRAFREPSAGLGHALHRGLVESLAAGAARPTDTWAILTAADLPFGFTDLDAALPDMSRPDGPRMLVGSKAHRDSVTGGDVKRRLGSVAYRTMRHLVAGMRTADSQGSIFVRLDLAAALAPRVAARDFFFSTELVFLAERLGEGVREVPIVLEPARRNSTVRFLRDGTAMLRQLTALTVREGRIHRQR